jgi:heat shock 70kDa protein 4
VNIGSPKCSGRICLDNRSKCEDRYAPFITSAEKEAEGWLYSEEDEDATKSAYVEKLDVLKVLGDPIAFR